MIQALDELHVGEHVGVAGAIHGAAIGQAHHVAGRLAAVDDFVRRRGCRSYESACVMVAEMGPACTVPPLFMPMVFFAPFDSSQCAVS